MIGSRLLALLVAACAVAATGLLAIPVESFETLGSGQVMSAPAPAPDPRLAVVPSHPAKLMESADHAAVPRLWLR